MAVPPDMAQILVVDDSPTMRNAIRILLAPEPDLEVCAEAATIPAALALCESEQPDIALIDISLKSEDGLDLVRDVRERYPAMRAVVFSLHDETHYRNAARDAGAMGYACKAEGPDILIDCIRNALNSPPPGGPVEP